MVLRSSYARPPGARLNNSLKPACQPRVGRSRTMRPRVQKRKRWRNTPPSSVASKMTRGPAAATRSEGQEVHLLDPIGTAAWPKPEQTAKICGLPEPGFRRTMPRFRGAANAGRNMCGLCNRMTRLSCQRDFHAIISWLEQQMDFAQVHVGRHYTGIGPFAKLLHAHVSQSDDAFLARRAPASPPGSLDHTSII